MIADTASAPAPVTDPVSRSADEVVHMVDDVTSEPTEQPKIIALCGADVTDLTEVGGPGRRPVCPLCADVATSKGWTWS